MDGGPFQFDNSEPTVLKGDELEKIIERSGGRVKVDEKAEAKARQTRARAGVLLRALPAKPKD